MMNLTLFKEDFLNKAPALFAKFVWTNNKVTVPVLAGNKDNIIVAHKMEVIHVPKTLIRESELNKIINTLGFGVMS